MSEKLVWGIIVMIVGKRRGSLKVICELIGNKSMEITRKCRKTFRTCSLEWVKIGRVVKLEGFYRGKGFFNTYELRLPPKCYPITVYPEHGQNSLKPQTRRFTSTL